MVTYNHIYKTKESLLDFMDSTGLCTVSNVLVRIHTAVHNISEAGDLVKTIGEKLPNAKLIGCSTSHIILEGQIIPEACLISFTTFSSAKLMTGTASIFDDNNKLHPGSVLAKNILEKIPEHAENAFVLMFFPLSYSRIEAVVNAINDSGRKIKLLGGTAYLENETEKNPCFVISGDRALSSEVGFCVIESPRIRIYSDYASGVESVGKKSPIKAKGTIIERVDNLKGGEWYSNLLGKAELDKNPAISEAFPVVSQDGREVAYHVDYKLNKETGEYFIETFPELSTGTRVSPGYFHPQKTFNQVSEIVNNVASHPSEAIFAYDCYARNSLLSNCAKWEIENFTSTNISGCLLSGEVSSREGKNIYTNLTFIIASLSEDKESYIPLVEPDVAAVQALQEENVQSLNFLLANATRALSEELSYREDMLRDAVFYNPAVGIDNQLKFQYDTEKKAFNKIAIFYLNNEKMLRLFAGVSETYGYLTDCYQKFVDAFNHLDLNIYSYQDTSLLYAANDSVSNEEFENTVDLMQDFLNSKSYGDIKLSFTAITILDETDPLSKIEIALDFAKNHKFLRVHYKDVVDDIEKEQGNIHVLWVIREALNHKRVVPYFQEIHSNIPDKPKLYESLMRIKDEEGNLYFPDTVLPLAKEYSLYDALSVQMVDTVMKMFLDKNSRVSINLNVQDIYNRQMLKMIFGNMKAAKHPQNYVFEIVETEEITDYEYIKSFADRIHEYGGKIAVDDFGSGFSNMLHIMRIDADYIKIDGGVIKEILKDTLVQDFVEFMQSWCQKNHQALICEFVENKEIQDILESFGVAYSQGYYFSKPHPWDPEDE